MTLNQTWKNCLRMWKWIVSEWKPGMDVESMKVEWLSKRKPSLNLESDCFFCQYDYDNRSLNSAGCVFCPGNLVNKRFECCAKTYHYEYHPKAFYKKLLYLDAKRRNNG